jgi:hypothetical protein
MTKEWYEHQAWIAYFDVLGFKSMINSKNYLTLKILQRAISDALFDLDRKVSKLKTNVNYLFYADTFIIYSTSEQIDDYLWFIHIAEDFISQCILKRLPIRGAISFGQIILGHDNKIVMGEAFLESYVYCEDQNWLGLILTPSASTKLKERRMNPIRHGFVNKDIPLRDYSIFDARIYAFKFNDGTNFKCPFLPILEEMRHRAPIKEKVKYENTIRFIEKHYTVYKI